MSKVLVSQAPSGSLWLTLALPLAHSVTVTLAHSSSLRHISAHKVLARLASHSCIAIVYPALKMMTVWERWLNQNHDHGKQFWSAPQRGCTRCWSGLGQRGSPEKQSKFWRGKKIIFKRPLIRETVYKETWKHVSMYCKPDLIVNTWLFLITGGMVWNPWPGTWKITITIATLQKKITVATVQQLWLTSYCIIHMWMWLWHY